VKIAVLFDTLHPEWEDAQYQEAVAAGTEEAEYDVARALVANGHEVVLIGVADRLDLVLARLASAAPALVFNGCEAFRGIARHEYGVAAALELHGFRYTGSSPTGLLVARNKALSKKILAYHGIRIPAFADFAPGEKGVRPSALRFPLIVKPLLEDASVGIAQASVVDDDAGLAERVRFVHEKFRQAAIVEELIEGRELYVGLLGNRPPEALPVVELRFGAPEGGAHQIATYKAKWDDDYRRRKGIHNAFPEDLSPAVSANIATVCTAAFRALLLQDYGRMDLRLTHDDELYLLEVNPNPFLARGHEMADAAERAGLSYERFVERIVAAALERADEG